ncbi:MAG TPA: G8 domain-containing protein, partial [Tepidisphaeraceae bacterium]|nr:G8 domain-containing protein [Tepidisphaeraceae bacterium]
MRTVATALLALVLALPAAAAAPDIAFSVRSAKSGAWSDPGTWTPARVPGKGDAVQVRPGHTVVYDASSDDAIRTIHVAGVLRFPRDKSTRLAVGLIKVTPGETCSEDGFVCHAPALPTTPSPDLPISATPALEIGTAADPIPATVTHTIRLTYFDGMDKETLPAIIACGGRWDCHGAPLSRTWVKLGATAAKGATAVTLAEPVTGWRVGDKVIVTASEQSYGHADTFRAKPGKPSYAKTEERVIIKIDGQTVTLDKGLEHAHLGAGDYRAEIANLSRNVVIESADPAGVRGHTLFHSRATGGVSYAEFRHLGKEGVLGKYAIHFHLVRETMRGSGVIGASVWDSHNRWVTVHASDFLLIRDNVGYQSVGHGFFLEDGTEQFNVIDRNLAVQAYHGKRLKDQALPFDSNDGAGFWWANGRNSVTRNVAVENDRYGYKFELRGKSRGFDPVARLRQPDGSMKEVDVRTLPFTRFDSNEAHCDGLYAVNLGDESDKTPSV